MNQLQQDTKAPRVESTYRVTRAIGHLLTQPEVLVDCRAGHVCSGILWYCFDPVDRVTEEHVFDFGRQHEPHVEGGKPLYLTDEAFSRSHNDAH